jgi:SAM-dependent methyltransferase
MRRIQWFEIHDQPWFPAFLRDQVTDALQLILRLGNFYEPIAGRLRQAVEKSGASQILDLCSGAGGPWISLYRKIDRPECAAVSVFLSDKYPNEHAFHRAQAISRNKIRFHADPVNATEVPPDFDGFRTLFTSFHHFPPREARAILQDAVNRRQGVGIFEVPGRHVITVVLTFLVPVADLLVTPFLRPFRGSRLLWTYVIPVVPLVLLFDGIVSCLRTYSPGELVELTGHLSDANEYEWDIGEERSGLLPITYLIGRPALSADGTNGLKR